MQLKPVDTVSTISASDFQENYYEPGLPLVIKDLAKEWPAYQNWNWDYFRERLGDHKVGVYNNVKSDPRTPVNKADDYVTFGKYIDMVSSGPAEWRIFLFNLFSHAPELTQDFTWPDHLLGGFVKRYPMLFMGGEGSITHMHFDMDLSHILHTQFAGRKRVLLFPNEEKHKLYRKPFEVMSQVDFSYYYDERKSKIDYHTYPALKHAQGYEITLNHGDTLFMPGGYWHHMEYIDSGYAMSLRALQDSWKEKVRGAWNLAGMRNIDTFMKRTVPDSWQQWKEQIVHARALRSLEQVGDENESEECGGFSPFLRIF